MNLAEDTVALTSPRSQRNMRKTFLITGILHAVIGILDLCFGIAAIITYAWFSYNAIPIWAGILFFTVTGLFGIASTASQHKNTLKRAYLAMSVLSACLAGAMAIVFGLAAENDNYTHEYCHPSRSYYSGYCPSYPSARVAINATLSFLAFCEMTVAIYSASAVCYTFSCCCPNGLEGNHSSWLINQPATTLPPGAVYNQGGMVPQSPNNRFVVVSPQQIPVQSGQVPPGQMVFQPQTLQGTPGCGQQNPSNLAVIHRQAVYPSHNAQVHSTAAQQNQSNPVIVSSQSVYPRPQNVHMSSASAQHHQSNTVVAMPPPNPHESQNQGGQSQWPPSPNPLNFNTDDLM